MGKFLDEKAIINTNIKNYNNFVNDKGKFIEGSPTFVTYYSKNNKASSEDIGLGAVVEIVGANSPIKYNRIEDFPLYNFNEAQLQYQFDEENGLDNEIEGEAIIVPGTIKPLPDDLFSVSYLNRTFLFKVTNQEGSSIGSKFFYKISYELSYNDINILEERQIEERYNVNYDSIGIKDKSIIEETKYQYLLKLENKIEELKDFYIKKFYDKNLNLFLYENIYDNYLHEFINKNRLFIEDKTFISNIIVYPALYVDDNYYKSFYYFLESNKIENISDVSNSIIESPILKDNKMTIFGRNYKDYNQVSWITTNEGILSNIINNLQFKKINKKSSNEDEYKWFSEILLEYFNEKEFIEDKIKPILDILNKQKLNISKEMYFFIPCIIFILKVLKNNIINNFSK